MQTYPHEALKFKEVSLDADMVIVKKLKEQFAHLYVVVTLPTRELNESFVWSYFKYGMQLGRPTFVLVQDIEMGFEKIVKIAHCRGVSNVFEESLRIMQRNEKGSGKPSNEFSIYLPGNKIPEWFSYQSLESSVNIQVLQNDLVNRKFMGIAICAVFGFDEYNSRLEHLIVSVYCDFEAYYDHIKICNGSRYYSTYYRPDRPIEFVHFDHMLLGYCSFDSSFQNPEKLPTGDSDYVNISIEFKSTDRHNQLKRCAVHPIYAEPIEIIGATLQEIGETSGKRSDRSDDNDEESGTIS
ncbi:hypothetical protein LWI29_031139 [Acer saccharum]|uniref:C-JID domain-containing protein n=1 Tax=Acer saccharum TaxID=4024 RepID=A0AA39T4T4_ACESA|nr:hypothetical protein LWI29_031139 [Acer saccharum]